MALLTITLDDTELAQLHQLATRHGITVETLARQALDDFVARQTADPAEWRRRVQAFFETADESMAPGISPNEAEADITAARAEVRQTPHAARGR